MPYAYGDFSYGAPTYYSGGMPYNYPYGAPLDQGGDDLGMRSEAPATILVRLPADAKLTIDGATTRSTEEVRTFLSPPLQAGKEYQYTLRAEVTRDGKKVERSREVTVRAGQQSEVVFDLPSQRGSSDQ